MSGLKNPKLVILILIALIGVSSCQKNDDSTPSTTTDRDKFLGTWHVSAYGNVSKQQYWDMVISTSASDPEQVKITNFDLQSGTTAFALVSGNNFSIATQAIGSETINGSGTYANGKLSFKYTANDGQSVDSVSATANK